MKVLIKTLILPLAKDNYLYTLVENDSSKNKAQNGLTNGAKITVSDCQF